MQEDLVPLKLPPGFLNNGTRYLAKGRWYTGSLVRFSQGTIQPVGGWVGRTLTGATIVGTPNAAVSWTTNAGVSYLAIGTTTGLYLINSSNFVSDITPNTVVGDGLIHEWQLEPFGTYLLATFARTSFVDTETINAFVWEGVPSTSAVPAYTSDTGPGSVFGVTVTPERFMVLLRGADPQAWAADEAEGGGGEPEGGDEGDEGGGGGAGGGSGGGEAPTTPTETPSIPVVTQVYSGRAVAQWTNTNTTASVRVEWSISATEGGSFAVAQTNEKTPETTSDTYFNSSGVWAKCRVQYFNAAGAGPWSGLSAATEVS